MAWIGAAIGAVGGLLSSSNQADATQAAGQQQANAANTASANQLSMFNTQQANQNAKYNQTRSDLSSLFGGNVGSNQSLVSNAMTPDQLRAQLLPQFTTAAHVFTNRDSDNPAIANQNSQPTIDEAGLQAAINAAMANGASSPNGGNGITNGSIFGPNAGMMNPQVQALLSGLRGTAGNQLSLFNSFNPQTMAQSIYDKLSMLGQPQRTLDRSNLESRLLNQGILTASPGYNQINSMDQANGQQDLARSIQAMTTAREQQQQYLANAQGAAGTAGNLQFQAMTPALQAAGIEAGVPINSAQPIPTGQQTIQGAQAAGQANVNAANITNSFWNSLSQNPTLQKGAASLFGSISDNQTPINTQPAQDYTNLFAGAATQAGY